MVLLSEKLNIIVFFLQLFFARESFVKTKAPAEYVIAGWAPKVNA